MIDDCKQAHCSYASIIRHIRESLGDCEPNDNVTWSDDYIKTSIIMSLSLITQDNRDEFIEPVTITLKNGDCLQSACSYGCEGIVKIPVNVNGKCNEPNENKTTISKWLAKNYKPICGSNKPDDYEISSVEILSDGGCNFKVNPPVPSTGVFTLVVMCFKPPCLDNDAIDSRYCRHFFEIVTLTLAHCYMLEDDRDVLNDKAKYHFDIYFKVSETGDTSKRDAYVESVKYGTRLNNNDSES
jgi:hypothetical protein